MKTEDFDKKLQRKLLELNADANEEEVNKIHDFIRSGKKRTWKKYSLFYLFGFLLIVSAAISGMQWHTIKSLTATNTELSKQMKELKTPTPAGKPGSEPGDKIHNDRPAGKTVQASIHQQQAGYENLPATGQKKEIPSAPDPAQKNKRMPSSENKTATLPEKFEALPAGTVARRSAAAVTPPLPAQFPDSTFAQVPHSKTSSNSNAPAESSSATQAPSPAEAPVSTLAHAPHSNTSLNSNLPAGSSAGIQSVSLSDSLHAHPEKSGDNTLAAERSVLSPPLVESNKDPGQRAVQSDSSKALGATVPPVPADTTPMVKHGWGKPVIRSLKYRAGLNGEAGASQLAAGIIGEALFNKHWSVSAGFKYTALDNETFNDEEDYHKRKGKDFKHEHTGTLMDTVQVTNIRQSYSLFQIPLSLNYVLPLKKRFALLFSLGTDIDIYGRNDIDYDSRNKGASDATHQNSSSKIPVAAFNNIVTAVAVEKQWSRFTVQLSPFLSPQLKKTDYKNKNLYYGARLRLFYTFP